MKLLIVEDDENKRQQMERFIRTKFSSADVSQRHSYQSGLKAILADTFDAILLDMSMPTFDKSAEEAGGRYRPFAGKEILAQMQIRGLKTPVIVVTQFDTFGEGSSGISLGELKSNLQEGFPELYVGTVYYNPALNNWGDELSHLLSSLLLSRGRGKP